MRNGNTLQIITLSICHPEWSEGSGRVLLTSQCTGAVARCAQAWQILRRCGWLRMTIRQLSFREKRGISLLRVAS